jgi:hypothetical protein
VQARSEAPAMKSVPHGSHQTDRIFDQDIVKSTAILQVVVTRGPAFKKVTGAELSGEFLMYPELKNVLIETSACCTAFSNSYLSHIYPSLHFW